MTFADVRGQDLVLAEINDLWVAPDRRRRGLGRQMLERLAADAQRKGAHRLRSGTGTDNGISLRLHARAGSPTAGVFIIQHMPV
jgi:L-amino acid N-acyltransferase YncA